MKMFTRVAIAGSLAVLGLIAGGCPGGTQGDPNRGDPNQSDPNSGDPNVVVDPNSVQPGDLVAFLQAEVVLRAADGYELHVSGIQPSPNVQVVLSPVTYIMQPEYWRIEVRAAALPAGSDPIVVGEYSVTLPLMGYFGTKGIEVAGATSSKKFDLPPQP